jgi:curved DNA-binding protein CbpA
MPSGSDGAIRALETLAQTILEQDHFTALGLSHTATREQVQAAFVEAAKKWHPDRAPAGREDVKALFTQVFSRLDAARSTLSDPTARLTYVGELRRSGALGSGGRTGAGGNQAEGALEFKKGEVLFKKGDLKQAEVHLRRAVELAPDVVDHTALLLWIQVKPETSPDELARVIAELDGLVAQDAKSARTFFYRGQLLKRVGRAAAANADFERAAALDKHNIDAAREVRLYAMRQGTKPTTKPETKPETKPDGEGGFFRRLFKR